MAHYVAFLRGINPGNRRLKMDALRARFEELNFRNVATFIASGNVRFETAAGDARQLEKRIERHLEKTRGYAVDTFVRTRTEAAAVATAVPFSAAGLAAPVHAIHAGFLKAPLDPAVARPLVLLC